MKKLLALFIAVLGIATVYAQPHTWLVYGSAGFSQNSNDNGYAYPQGTNTSWKIAPGIGYQFNKHLTVGVQGSYNHDESGLSPSITNPVYYNYFYNTAVTTISWSAGAFFRYTQNIGKIFFLYGQANMSYTSSGLNNAPFYYSSNGVIYETSAPSNGFQAQLFPAIGAKVYKGLALNFSFGGINYTTTSQDINGAGTNRSSNIALTLGQQVNIGVSENFKCHMMHRHKHHHHSSEVAGSEYRHVDNGGTEEDDAPAPVAEPKKHHKHKTEKTDDN